MIGGGCEREHREHSSEKGNWNRVWGEENIAGKKMSGTVKKVTDVAFKVGKNIDWDGMGKLLVSDEARREFSNLRRAFDEVNSQLQTKFSQVASLSPISLALITLCTGFGMRISVLILRC